MKSIKKRILGLILTAGLFAGVFVPMQANAEWQKNNNNWTYIENGAKKTGWLQDGGKWYYLNSEGIMKKGWIQDNGTWYYLLKDGSLNDSKATTTIPTEIKNATDIMKSYSQSLNFTYRGQVYPSMGTSFYNAGIKDSKLISFNASDQYGSDAGYYFYDPSECKIYKMKEDYSVSVVGQPVINNKITKDQAVQNIQDYIQSNNVNVSGMQQTVSEEENIYKVYYMAEGTNSSASIVEKFYIDKATGIVLDMYDI